MGADISSPKLKLGAWLNGTTGTIYQAATDGFVVAMISGDLTLRIDTDNSTPPSIQRQEIRVTVNFMRNCCSPVKKFDYWQVLNGLTIYWIPLI